MGSTDVYTNQLIKKEALENGNVVVVDVPGCESENVAAAFDCGVKKARGSYILFANAAEELETDGLSVMLAEIDNGRNFEIVLSNAEIGGEMPQVIDNYKIITAVAGKNAMTNVKEVLPNVKDLIAGDANVLYRRSFLEKHKLSHQGRMPFIEKAMQESRKLAVVPFVGCKFYR